MYQLQKEMLGNPGEVKGTVNNDCIGNITTNSEFGLFGKIKDENIFNSFNEPIEIALRNEINLRRCSNY